MTELRMIVSYTEAMELFVCSVDVKTKLSYRQVSGKLMLLKRVCDGIPAPTFEELLIWCDTNHLFPGDLLSPTEFRNKPDPINVLVKDVIKINDRNEKLYKKLREYREAGTHIHMTFLD